MGDLAPTVLTVVAPSHRMKVDVDSSVVQPEAIRPMSSVKPGVALLLSGFAGAVGLGLLFVLTVIGGGWSMTDYVMAGLALAIGFLGGVAIHSVIAKVRAVSTGGSDAGGTGTSEAPTYDDGDPSPSRADIMGGGPDDG